MSFAARLWAFVFRKWFECTVTHRSYLSIAFAPGPKCMKHIAGVILNKQMGVLILSNVIPHCLNLICAHAIVVLLVVCLWFSIHTAQGLLTLFCRLTSGQAALICISLHGKVIHRAYNAER